MAPSDLDLALCHSAPYGARWQRATSHEIGLCHRDDCGNDVLHEKSAKIGVCFPPPPEDRHDQHFDFKALEEFVSEHDRGRISSESKHHRRMSVSPGSQDKGLDDLRRRRRSTTNDDSLQLPKAISDNVSGLPGSPEYGFNESKTMDEKTTGFAAASSYVDSQVEHTRFSFFSRKLDSTIHATDIRDLVSPAQSFHDLFHGEPNEDAWWLDVLNPTEGEVNALAKAFGIHPLTVEDIMTQEAREKVEIFGCYYFLSFRSFYQTDRAGNRSVEPANVYAVVHCEGVLSFTFHQSHHAAGVRDRLRKLPDCVPMGSDWICYALIGSMVDNFYPLIHEIEQEIGMIEDSASITRADDFRPFLRQIYMCRRKVMTFKRLLHGKLGILRGLIRRCDEQNSASARSEIGLYLSDTDDHLTTIRSTLDQFETMLSRSRSNYLAKLSVDRIRVGNRLTEFLSKITAIAAILLPLNIICALFGMNVSVPGGDTDGLNWWFGIFGIILMIVLASLIVARRMKMI